MAGAMPILRGFAALIGSAMAGGVAVASALQGGLVPALAPHPSSSASPSAAAMIAMAGPAIPRGRAARTLLADRLPGRPDEMRRDEVGRAVQAEAAPSVYDAINLPPPPARLRGTAARRVRAPLPKASWLDEHVPDGDRYGADRRLYVFAAAGDQAVGMNYLPAGDRWLRDGWSRDHLSMISDGAAGVGLRRGAVQVSFGYELRRTRTERVYETLILPPHEDRVTVSLSIKQ
jgi:hypothetical protein